MSDRNQEVSDSFNSLLFSHRKLTRAESCTTHTVKSKEGRREERSSGTGRQGDGTGGYRVDVKRIVHGKGCGGGVADLVHHMSPMATFQACVHWRADAGTVCMTPTTLALWDLCHRPTLPVSGTLARDKRSMCCT